MILFTVGSASTYRVLSQEAMMGRFVDSITDPLHFCTLIHGRPR